MWVAPAGSYNLLDTAPFAPDAPGRSSDGSRGCGRCGLYRGGLLDYGERRVLVIAPPRESTPLLPADQTPRRQPGPGRQRGYAAGGWVVLSRALAEERHLHIGQAVTLPSPGPHELPRGGALHEHRLGAGLDLMNAADYARAWGSNDASAYSVLLEPGVTPHRLCTRDPKPPWDRNSGLTVQTRRGTARSSNGRSAAKRSPASPRSPR